MAIASNKRRRRRNTSPVAANRRHRRRRNLGAPIASNRRHRRRNPGAISKYGGIVKNTFISGAYAIGGGVLTRSIPQALLGERNRGIFGYLANLVVAGVGGGLVAKVAGPQAGQMFGIGGAVMFVSRVFEDVVGTSYVQFSDVSASLPIPQVLSGDKSFDFRRKGMRGEYLPRLRGEYLPRGGGVAQLPAADFGLSGVGNETWASAWS
jgi:hypothetical protein